LGEFTVSRIDAILSIANPTGFAIALSDFINSRPTPFERMSPGEQAAYCVDELEREVNNGGFEQFFLTRAATTHVRWLTRFSA
jgi:hypothetical protein